MSSGEDDKIYLNPEGTGTRTPPTKYSPENLRLWFNAPSLPEDGIVQFEIDDIPKKTKESLSQYLSDLTKNAPNTNAFPVYAQPYQEFTLSTQDGSGTPPLSPGTTPGFLGQLKHINEDGAAAVSVFNTLSDSGKFISLGELINKLSNRNMVDHHFLTSIKATSEPFERGVGSTTGEPYRKTPSNAPPVQKRISEILVSNNRFTPTSESPYIQDGEFSNPGNVVPAGLGTSEYLPNQRYDHSGVIGAELNLRQTGHKEDPNEVDWWGLTSVTKVQMGGTMDSSDLYAGNTSNAPPRIKVGAELIRSDPETFGALNNYAEPFAGGNPIAMVFVAGQSMALALGAAMIFGLILEIISKCMETWQENRNREGTLTSDKGPTGVNRPMGHSSYKAIRQAVFSTMGVPVTKNNFLLCLMTGLCQFLGVAVDDWPDVTERPGPIPGSMVGAFFLKIVGLILEIFMNITAFSGYLATMGRVLNRDFSQLIDRLSEQFSSPFGIANAALNIVGLIGSISSTASFRFFMALAKAGDAAINAINGTFSPPGAQVDNLLETGQTRQAKSRRWHGSSELAWRTSASPTLTLLPKQMVSAFAAFDRGGRTPLEIAGKIRQSTSRTGNANYDKFNNNTMVAGVGGRIKDEDRKMIEDVLDAEYMPFYFHDLRTNEVISFLAFLSDTKDSYSTTYAETGGYGRADKVKIYQDTARQISLTFWVVATGPNDFDVMWWKINKLIALLYPQWSRGNIVKAPGGSSFIQPFSQIPTASPMIRLRVGDVIKSNYSRFNAARLFGLGSVNSQKDTDAYADGSPVTTKDETPPFSVGQDAVDAAKAKENEKKLQAQVKRHKTSLADGGGYVKGEKVRFPVEIPGGDGMALGVDVKSDDVKQLPPMRIPYKVSADKIPGEIVQVLPKGQKGAVGDLADLSKGDDYYLVKLPTGFYDSGDKGLKAQFKHTYVGSKKKTVQLAYWISAAALNVEEKQNGYFKAGSKAPETVQPVDEAAIFDQAIHDFFDPAKNAIIKSFESAGGKGLAGVITSFDMDWNEQLWETQGLGNRAPKSMTISITFSPIHDIAPGLDHFGMQRAINYNVGKISNTLGKDHYESGYAGIDNSAAQTDTGNARKFMEVAKGALQDGVDE